MNLHFVGKHNTNNRYIFNFIKMDNHFKAHYEIYALTNSIIQNKAYQYDYLWTIQPMTN